jgi:cell shape-determining protein MreC
MVKKTGTLVLFLILFLLVLALFYIHKKQKIEPFTPEVRKLVRPHLRSMRLTADEYKNTFKDQAGKLFNMFGLQFA